MSTPWDIPFAGMKPVQFGQPAADHAKNEKAAEAEGNRKADTAPEKAGQTFLSRVQKRRMAGIKRAAELLEILPARGEILHCLMLGYFDLLNAVLALLDREGITANHLRIATLCFSIRNVSELAALLDTGQARKIDLLTSDFQRKHDAAILAAAQQELTIARKQRLAAARSHCKIVLIELEDGRHYVLEGSANLRTSRNQEQFTISQDSELHAFYALWFDQMMTRHEIDASGSSGAS